MSVTSYFIGTAFSGPVWLKWVMLAVIVLGIGLGAIFFAARANHAPSVYSPKLAWVLAWIYYCFAILFSWVTGALGVVLEQFGFPGIVNALLLVAILSAYNMNYQVGWWDIFVSPRHNIRATNAGKVALSHQPFLIATLTLLIMYGDAGMFVLLYTFAMTSSAIAMRFPAPWEHGGEQVSRDTAIGE